MSLRTWHHVDVGRPSVLFQRDLRHEDFKFLAEGLSDSSGKVQELNPSLLTPTSGVGLETSFHT